MPNNVDRMLRDCGAVLVRQRKHEVWKLPNGTTFVRSKTPSDRFALKKQIATLSRGLAS